jgi:hypothetical protein
MIDFGSSRPSSSLDTARTELTIAAAAMDKMAIRAPIAGKVLLVNAKPVSLCLRPRSSRAVTTAGLGRRFSGSCLSPQINRNPGVADMSHILGIYRPKMSKTAVNGYSNLLAPTR